MTPVPDPQERAPADTFVARLLRAADDEITSEAFTALATIARTLGVYHEAAQCESIQAVGVLLANTIAHRWQPRTPAATGTAGNRYGVIAVSGCPNCAPGCPCLHPGLPVIAGAGGGCRG